MPNIYKASQFGSTSTFNVQNVSGSSTTINVIFVAHDSNNQGDLLVTGDNGSGAEAFAVFNETNPLTHSTLLTAGQSLGVSPNTSDPLVARDFSFLGSASISGSGDQIAAVVAVQDPASSGAFHQALVQYDGFTDPTSSQRVYLPTILKDTLGPLAFIDRVAVTDGAMAALVGLDGGGQELLVKIGNQPFQTILGVGSTLPGFSSPVSHIDISPNGFVGFNLNNSNGLMGDSLYSTRPYFGQLAAAIFLQDGTGVISLITIPEPGTLLVLLVVGPALLRRRVVA